MERKSSKDWASEYKDKADELLKGDMVAAKLLAKNVGGQMNDGDAAAFFGSMMIMLDLIEVLSKSSHIANNSLASVIVALNTLLLHNTSAFLDGCEALEEATVRLLMEGMNENDLKEIAKRMSESMRVKGTDVIQ